jgi:CheY-like chemotaxis protein
MARILSISYDPTLLRTREIILREAGYEIKSALGISEAIEACNEHYDLIVMGHSIPESDKREVVRELRNRGCHSPILSLNRFGERPIPEAAQTVEPDPKLVLEAICSLLPGWFKFLCRKRFLVFNLMYISWNIMPLTGCTIVEVDDYEPHNYVLSRMLEHAGCKVLRAFTGCEALELALKKPDAILLDINLPDIDGFEVCRRLSEDPLTRKIPVVFHTATYQHSSAKERAERVGAKAILFFPVEGNQLIAVLQGCIAKAKSQ